VSGAIARTIGLKRRADHLGRRRLVAGLPCLKKKALRMKTTLIISVAMLIAASSLAPQAAQAQRAGTRRTDLQRHDLSAPGRELVQVRVDFDPGYVAPMHTHPGEEIIYVIEGTLEYEIGGKVSKVKAGEVLFVPAGTRHTARNIGTTNAAELATYVVEKGKPLLTPVKEK
jgi:quercetin dioxygenase-like cupin family protein